jgi:hypothetical protein
MPAPVISQFSPDELAPGSVGLLVGTDIPAAPNSTGLVPGQIMLMLPGQDAQRLSRLSTNVIGAGATAVQAIQVQVDPALRDVWSDPNAFVIVIGEADGNGFFSSNRWPVKFEASMRYWTATFKTELTAVFGAHGPADGVIAQGAQLKAPQQLLGVMLSKEGSGWAKLQAPMANGYSLEQGYHIGVGGFEHEKIAIHYIVRGPLGFKPDQVAGLLPWDEYSAMPIFPIDRV